MTIGDQNENTLVGSAGVDLHVGLGGADTLLGGLGNDLLSGGSGNDTLVGGNGSDLIDGGEGSADVATYSGSRSDYEIYKVGNGFVIRKPGATVQDPPTEIDVLTNVETVRFEGDVPATDVNLVTATIGNGLDGEQSTFSETDSAGTLITLQSAFDPLVTVGSGEEGVNTTTVGSQHDVRTAILNDRTYVSVWRSDADNRIYGQRFDNEGNKLGGEFTVETASTNLGLPDIASSSDGGFVVAWSRDSDNNDEVFFRRFDATGAAVAGSLTQVDSTSSSNIDADLTGAPDIVRLENGNFVVGWERAFPVSSSTPNQSFFRVFDNSGTPISGPELVETGTAPSTKPEFVATPDGGFLVFAHFDDARQDVTRRRFDNNGTRVGDRERLDLELDGVNVPADNTVKPSVTFLIDGGYVLAVSQNGNALQGGQPTGHLFLQRFSSNDQKIGDVVTVDDDGGVGKHINPSIRALSDGGWVVVWEQEFDSPGRGQGVYARQFDSAGHPGAVVHVADGTAGAQLAPEVETLEDGRFVVTWESNGDIRQSFFSPVGTMITGTEDQDSLVGFGGDDELSGLGGNDLLNGASGDDLLLGGDGEDILIGGLGNDTYNGGRGDDIIEGGSGDDTAVFSGSSTDYVLTANANGTVTVQDTVAGRDGIDTVIGVEHFTFGDGVTISPPIVTVPANALQVSEDQSIAVQGVSIADPDIGSGVIKTELSVANGALTLGAITGLTFQEATANGQSRLVFEATLADTNLALASLSYLGDVNSDIDDVLSITATEGGFGLPAATLDIIVDAVADAATVSASTPSLTDLVIDGTTGADTLTGGAGNDTINGFDGNDVLNGDGDVTGLAVDITAALSDLDGSEVLNVILTGIPAGVTFSAGTVNSDGSVTLAASELAGLTTTIPAGQGAFDLTITARATESVSDNEFDTSDNSSDTVTTLSLGGASVSFGDDTLTGGDGDDLLHGGGGDDVLVGDGRVEGTPVPRAPVLIDLAGSSVLASPGLDTSATFDDETVQNGPTSELINTGNSAFVGRVWGEATQVELVRIWRPDNTGFDGTGGGGTITFEVQGSNSSDFSTAVTLGSTSVSDYDGARSATNAFVDVNVDTAAFAFHRLVITGAGDGLRAAEIQFYGPSTTESGIPKLLDQTIGATIAADGASATNAFDGDVSQNGSGSELINTGTSSFIGKIWGQSTSIGLVRVWRPSDTGFDGTAGSGSITFVVEGSNSSDFSGATVLGSATRTDYDGARIVGDEYVEIATDTTAFAFHRVVITGAGDGVRTAELQFFSPSDPASLHPFKLDPTFGSTLGGDGVDASTVFDGDPNQGVSSAELIATGTSNFVGKEWGQATAIDLVRVWRPTDTGYDGTSGSGTITFVVEGSNSSDFSGASTLGQAIVADYDGPRMGTDSFVDIPVESVEFAFHRVVITGVGNGVRAAEVEFFSPNISASGNDTLFGGAGDDLLDAGTGDDTLDGGTGSDTILFDRGDGNDLIDTDDNDSSSTDVVKFGGAVDFDELWFAQTGDDLLVSVLDSGGTITVDDWFAATDADSHRIDAFEAGGYTIAVSGVNQLVQAMASWSGNNGGLDGDDLIQMPNDPDNLSPALASAWTQIS